ncbi:hypothetical protein B0A52_02670 [Exophiala mesophila]|uniref:Sfi1 spindle body domain-containing protein n=1 Tax=Exophiala mesophila TaxID=212818 RepID=A0A438NDJ2_EXOME|nr:hypothetical protein B0A52_02670 [Exophiala mesophila]
MSPEELASFARAISNFPQQHIDHLYQLLLRLQETHVDPDLDLIRSEYHALSSEDGNDTLPNDPYLQWIIDLFNSDAHSSLYTNFLDVLDEAHIDITDAGTNTDVETDHGRHAGPMVASWEPQPAERSHSPDTFNEHDPRWRQAIALDHRKLASQALEAWRDGLQRKREAILDYEDARANEFADQFYHKTLARKAVSHWRNTVKEMQSLERVAIEHRARKDAIAVLTSWTLGAREGLFKRVRDERLLYASLGMWQGKVDTIREMQQKADIQYETHVTQQVLVKLFTTTSQLQQDQTQAALTYKQMLSRKILRLWRAQLNNLGALERKRESLMSTFAGRHVLRLWYDRTRSQIDEKQALLAREQMLKVKFFRRWQAYVKQSKEAKYTIAYQRMRRKVKVGIATAVLTNWRQQVSKIRRMREVADEFQARQNAEAEHRLALVAIMSMYNKTQQIGDSLQQAQKFRREKIIARLEIFGNRWLLPTRQIMVNQRTADNYHSIKTAGYTLSRLRSWRNVTYRVKRLEDDADRLTQRNERKRTADLLQKWRRGAIKWDSENQGIEERLLPVTPAARRSQLLASTTPASTPASALFRKTRALKGHRQEDED